MVADGVVLDLRYEARDIAQHITSQKKVDDWFGAKTRGLSNIAKIRLKQKWGSLQTIVRDYLTASGITSSGR